MDITKVSTGIDKVGGQKLSDSLSPSKAGKSFKDTLDKIQSGFERAATEVGKKPQVAEASTVGDLKFSTHAVDRMRTRGIQFSQEIMNRLEQGVSMASKKGSKNSLVLMGDTAAIVSVENKTVVTVMDKSMMKENVFTNIDSTVVV